MPQKPQLSALPRFVLVWVFTAIFWALLLGTYLLTLRLLPDAWLTHAIRFWGRAVLGILGIRLTLVNPMPWADPVRGRVPRVVVCNHQSALDLVWGAVICPPGVLAIGKREVLYIPVLNVIWWALRFIRIDRSNTQDAVARLQGVADAILSDDRTLVIAPEGTRSPDGQVLPFKKGAFHIAVQAQVPITPIVIHGAYELCPKTRLLAAAGELRLKFLPEVPTAGLTADDVDRLAAQVEAAVREGLRGLRQS